MDQLLIQLWLCVQLMLTRNLYYSWYLSRNCCKWGWDGYKFYCMLGLEVTDLLISSHYTQYVTVVHSRW